MHGQVDIVPRDLKSKAVQIAIIQIRKTGKSFIIKQQLEMHQIHQSTGGSLYMAKRRGSVYNRV